ncbi:MAG: phospholipase A [Herminiimonas sp.]|nr:phospholipase A [Herminiimonas sp.]
MQSVSSLKVLLTIFVLSASTAQPGELEQQMLRGSVLGDASARLGCFDALTKAATAATVAGNPTPDPTVAANVRPVAKAIPAIASSTMAPPETPISRLEQSWEITPAARRGVFSFRSHPDNHLLLANYSTQTNDEPYREFTPAGIKSKRVELSYQLSFKMKMAEQPADLPVDLWFGYTQQSFWQAYNRAASSPFRETNYQPEVIGICQRSW